MGFVHLHVHSHYSKGFGIPTVEEIVKRAKELNMEKVALTDINGIYGLFDLLHWAEEYSVEPILGSELIQGSIRALCLVMDERGYQNLCHIISDLHCHKDLDLISSLKERGEGLIIISHIPELLLPLKELYPSQIFYELSLGHNPLSHYGQAKELGIRPLATARVCMLWPESMELHRVLRAVALNKKLSRLLPHEVAGPRDYMATEEEMKGAFAFAPEALETTLEVADMCKKSWKFQTIFPLFKELSRDEAFELLYKKTIEGCRKRYGQLTPKIMERIQYEMEIIREKGYAHYFLLVEEIAKVSFRTCGRGSAAASIVSYALGLTHVDPIRHGLMFERFLNPGRIDPPDIDLDFAWDERDLVLDYVFSRYGKDKVGLVANHNTFGPRAAIRSVARVMGIPEAEISDFTKRVGHSWELDDHLFSHPRLRDIKNRELWEEVVRLAARLQNHFYHLSTHCGGVVVVPDDIRNYCPVEISQKGYQVLQWEKDGVEDSGLVKIDLLGNRTIAVIRDTIKMLIAQGLVPIGLDEYYMALDPIKDIDTIKIFYNANTIGVFYFESPATRRVLTQVRYGIPFEEYLNMDHFHINVVVTSIIRPASNKSIKTWIERLHGKAWGPPHPLLYPVLEETLGVMVFQEQLSQAAIHMAGFSHHEADTLRKVVTKKHKGKSLKDFFQRFKSGAMERGIDEGVIEEVWDMIMGFDGYSFCKAHSASYTMLAYKSAYLKAHYPAQFMAAVISNQGGYYSTYAYLSEARRMGIRILCPDINKSQVHYTGGKNWIRMGLMAIKGLPTKLQKRIVTERQERGPYKTIEEFIIRLGKNMIFEDVKLLIKAGCFDSVATSRKEAMWEALKVWNDRGRASSFYTLSENRVFYGKQAPGPLELAKEEVEVFGFPISAHPLELYGIGSDQKRFVKARDLKAHVGMEVSMVGWWITHKSVYTRNGEPMKFVTFEDQTGLFEVVVFPDVYKRYSHLLLGAPYPYLIRGKVEEEKGAIAITASHIHIMNRQRPMGYESRETEAFNVRHFLWG